MRYIEGLQALTFEKDAYDYETLESFTRDINKSIARYKAEL